MRLFAAYSPRTSGSIVLYSFANSGSCMSSLVSSCKSLIPDFHTKRESNSRFVQVCAKPLGTVLSELYGLFVSYPPHGSSAPSAKPVMTSPVARSSTRYSKRSLGKCSLALWMQSSRVSHRPHHSEYSHLTCGFVLAYVHFVRLSGFVCMLVSLLAFLSASRQLLVDGFDICF